MDSDLLFENSVAVSVNGMVYDDSEALEEANVVKLEIEELEDTADSWRLLEPLVEKLLEDAKAVVVE